MRKSKHNLSNFELTTASMGKLYPVNVREVLPNDTFIGRTECFARMQPLVRPIMHPVRIIFQHWYCPNRILWEDFEEFYTQGGIDDEYPVYPTIKFSDAVAAGSLANRLGVPVGQKGLEVSALPFRMYNLIWNDRYRNQELETPKVISYESGIDTTTSTELLSPLWSRDYFTTSMVSTQKGTSVLVPASNETVEVSYKESFLVSCNLTQLVFGTDNFSGYDWRLSNWTITIPKSVISSVLSGTYIVRASTFAPTNVTTNDNNGYPITFRSSTGITLTFPAGKKLYKGWSPYKLRSDFTLILKSNGKADDSASVSESISFSSGNSSVAIIEQPAGSVRQSFIDLRDIATASHLQKLKEKAEIYGNRYEERLQREFNLRPRDGRIARPEYLGGSSQVFQTSEVLQTAEAENSGVGNMRGHGVSLSSSNRFRFRFPEHGWFMTLMSIRPISVYTQGIDRQLLRRAPTDHYLPDLANAGGLQEVYQQELFATDTNKGVVFGYQGLYDDYRQSRSRVTGDFLTTEQNWHLARQFAEAPVLNESFVSMANGDFSRIFNVTDKNYDTMLFMINNHLKAYRPIPKRLKTTSIG